MDFQPGCEDLSDRLELAYALHAECSRRSLWYYLDNVVINAQPRPKRFGLRDQWQTDLLTPKVPALEALAGLREYAGPRWFMTVLSRGHDKSSLEGRLAVWCLLASKRVIHGYIIASDEDQGLLIIQAIRDELAHNPWVADQIQVTRNRITGPAGDVQVLAADVKSAYGLRGNLYICDELTHWQKEAMWGAVYSGLHKIPGSVCVAITNAGLLDSWQWKLREEARSDPKWWTVFEREGHLASWLSKEEVAALKRGLPPSEAERLFENKWIDPASEFDYLRRPEVQACADLGKSLRLTTRLRREPGVSNYVVGLDYGARKDRTVFAVIHLDDTGRTRIDRMDVWQGTPADPVAVSRVEEHVWRLDAAFKPAAWVVDPYQMAGTIEKMQARGLPVEPFNARAGAGNYEMAQHLRSRIVSRLVAWPAGCGDLEVKGKVESLVDELAGLRVRRMPYGFRFDHENQKHDDRAVALAMADLKAVTLPPPPKPGPVVPLTLTAGPN